MLSNSLLGVAMLAQLACAQFPPPREGVTWVKSKHHEGITISYKNPEICETTPGVKSYSGYVHLPPNSINETGETQNYPINTFFWFIESRKDPHHAPLSIWLNGGPGGSSLLGMLAENGPCIINDDSNSTILNPWSWNNEVNMLFIDQPVQVGFSYDTLNNGTYDLLALDPMDESPDAAFPIQLDDFADGVPETNSTFFVGTFASQNLTHVPNSTDHAAVALWHFAQTWFEEFPEYKPHDEKISLWAESYGGHYGPRFMDFFRKQNGKIDSGEISGPGTHYLHLDTLGLVNACIDDYVQDPSYSFFAWNNTYGLSAINETTKHKQLYELSRPGGILEQIGECQRLSRALETSGDADAGYVEAYCRNTSEYTTSTLVQPYMESGKFGWFDVTHPNADPFPPNHHLGWLGQQWVQRALGVPVNFTWLSMPVASAFTRHGDMPRGGYLEGLGRLLDGGVAVHLVYGDRDYACNWVGGEAASLAIPHRHQRGFAAAGYAPLTVSPPDRPPFVPYGLTRQHGNLSFTRVYQAGHMVPSYQPEASLRIFERALSGRDIATGLVDLRATGGWAEGGGADVFSTEGPGDAWWKRSEVMPVPERRCYSLMTSTCSKEDLEALRNGTAIVKDYFVVGIEGGEEDGGESSMEGSDGRYGGGMNGKGEGEQVAFADAEEL
ncbi:hypothetical protein VSDG_01803 [Cytospora chrysosperma]|uniref:Carboxypeptidase n=1 Tax=Cytospora chrysosperma TaxID=252740 RepID=A0A423WHE5_CYTCH|nr:hypothetical protein VSDG_01803 [Valsa sordida]